MNGKVLSPQECSYQCNLAKNLNEMPAADESDAIIANSEEYAKVILLKYARNIEPFEQWLYASDIKGASFYSI